MPKSNYPSKYDTSVELPPVRNNIIEVGPDAINGLRSAIINIERTLGIDPHGTTGNTVASRLSQSLDNNGNIKSAALSLSNIITGPIFNRDVAELAAITEGKLKLDIPTSVLQAQTSTIKSDLEALITRISEISSVLSAHTSDVAVNRHKAKAISVDAYTSTPKSTSQHNLLNSSVQTSLENIYDHHINYDGSDISESNKSHGATQIFFDNTEVSSSITSSDLQSVIEELANLELSQKVSHQNVFHSSGQSVFGPLGSSDLPLETNFISEDISISFSKNTGLSTNLTLVTLNDPLDTTGIDISEFTIIKVSDTADINNEYSGFYEISRYNETASNLDSVFIYGLLSEASTGTTKAKIMKPLLNYSPNSSLLLGVRENALLTSADSIQIANPDSVYVESLEVKPSEVTVGKSLFNIVIDGVSTEIDAFNTLVTSQTLESITSKLNREFAVNHLDVTAYKSDLPNNSELIISHILPDDSSDKHTLQITRAGDDGIDALGFNYIEDLVSKSIFGSEYAIRGKDLRGLSGKIDSTELSFLSGTNIVSTAASGLDFLGKLIKVGDLITITDASTSSDNGTYKITSLTSSELTLSSEQLAVGFAGVSDSSTRFRIFKNIISLDSLTFESIGGGFGASVIDIFMEESQNVFYN